MDNDLGLKVKKLRISQGLTQEDVAKALDVTPGYISNVENGRNLMTLRMLSYYAELTNVSLDYLALFAHRFYRRSNLQRITSSPEYKNLIRPSLLYLSKILPKKRPSKIISTAG